MDGEKALVTIGVPVYNGERYLAQCLDSLLSQTYGNFVLLISDNASTDRTQQICDGYVKSDRRVRYHRNPRNIGLYGNFNQVLGLVRTPYIKLASADDFWAPTMLADALEQMQSDPSLVLCYPRAVMVREDGREIGRYDKSLNLLEDDPSLRFRRVLTESGLINQLMGVMRTEAVHSMLPLMKQPGADWVFLAELSLYGKIMELPKFQYFRRFHEGAGSWDRESEAHYVRLISSEGTRRVRLRAWKHHCGLMRRVVRSPLRFRAKMELLRFLGRRAVWDRAALIDDCRQLLWPARTK